MGDEPREQLARLDGLKAPESCRWGGTTSSKSLRTRRGLSLLMGDIRLRFVAIVGRSIQNVEVNKRMSAPFSFFFVSSSLFLAEELNKKGAKVWQIEKFSSKRRWLIGDGRRQGNGTFQTCSKRLISIIQVVLCEES